MTQMEHITGTLAKAGDRFAIDLLGIPSLLLMERASRFVADEVLEHHRDRRTLVLCGTGNNGADGICIARMLREGGMEPEVLVCGDLTRASWEFLRQLSDYRAMGGAVRFDDAALPEADLIVDAAFGIGLNRPLTGPWRELLARADGMQAHRIAVDVPSGISADTGEAMGPVLRADLTLTFGKNKTGLVSGDGKTAAGEVRVCDIGIPDAVYRLLQASSGDAASAQVSVQESAKDAVQNAELQHCLRELVDWVLLNLDRPSEFFYRLQRSGKLGQWFPVLSALEDVPQARFYHPEKDAFVHTMMVLDKAAEESRNHAALAGNRSRRLRFLYAALLHDLGKAVSTAYDEEKQDYRAVGHEKTGAELAEGLLRRIGADEDLIAWVTNLVLLHMVPHQLYKEKPNDKAFQRLFRRSVCPEDLILLAYCDAAGTGSGEAGADAGKNPGDANQAAQGEAAQDQLARDQEAQDQAAKHWQIMNLKKAEENRRYATGCLLRTRIQTENDRLRKQLSFILAADQEKNIFRQTRLSDGCRKENDSEHAWHLALMAMLLSEYSAEPVDLLKVIMMVLIHDVVEIDAGDTYAYDYEALKTAPMREKQAAEHLYGLLPADQGQYLKGIWEEFEAFETPEAKLAHTLDNLQPLMLTDAEGGTAWMEHGAADANIYRRNSRTGETAPEIWAYMKSVVERNVAEGRLQHEEEAKRKE